MQALHYGTKVLNVIPAIIRKFFAVRYYQNKIIGLSPHSTLCIPIIITKRIPNIIWSRHSGSKVPAVIELLSHFCEFSYRTHPKTMLELLIGRLIRKSYHVLLGSASTALWDEGSGRVSRDNFWRSDLIKTRWLDCLSPQHFLSANINLSHE